MTTILNSMAIIALAIWAILHQRQKHYKIYLDPKEEN